MSHAQCASEARSIGRSVRPAAAVVDVGLPDGSGFEIVDFLLRLAAPCASVVLTGGAASDGGRQAARLGVVDYLIKPVRLDVLELALQRAEEQTSRMRAWAHRRPSTAPIRALDSSAAPHDGESQVLAAAVIEFGLTDRQSEALFGSRAASPTKRSRTRCTCPTAASASC